MRHGPSTGERRSHEPHRRGPARRSGRTAVAFGAALLGLWVAAVPASAAQQHRYWVSVSGTHAADQMAEYPLRREGSICIDGYALKSADRETVKTLSRGIITYVPQRGQDPESLSFSRPGKVRITGGNRTDKLYEYQQTGPGQCDRVDNPEPPTINACRTDRVDMSALRVSVKPISRRRARVSVNWGMLPGCQTLTVSVYKAASTTVSLIPLRQGRGVRARLKLDATSTSSTTKLTEWQRFDVVLSPTQRR